MRSSKLVMLTQVYPPDPAAVGQQMADAAAELVRRGHEVTVYTADRGYDDPRVRYARRERLNGVDVRRLPFSSFGKGSLTSRLAGGGCLLAQAVTRALFQSGIGGVIVSTSPPIAAVGGLLLSCLRGVPLKLWLMDLNPDQLVAAGMAQRSSLSVRLLDALNRSALRRAADVIVLDPYMAERVARKADIRHKLVINPPWAHEHHVEPVRHSENPFRRWHALEGRRVIMYSGNHTPTNPIDTILRAAGRLEDLPELRFVFVGGGQGKRSVEECSAGNVVSLPYQPLADLRFSLSAADVHLVSLGDEMVGIVHPCKVYGAMAAARPILLLGPRDSHIGDILARDEIGWHIPHGDVDAAERTLRTIAAMPAEELKRMGRRARRLLDRSFGMDALLGGCCDTLARPARTAATREAHNSARLDQ